MKPNPALNPNSNCIEFYRGEDGKYFAVEIGIVNKVTPGSRYYQIALEAALKHPNHAQMLRKFGPGNALVFGFIDQVWSGFNNLPDVVNGKLADQDGDIYTSMGKVNPREREVIRKIAEGKSDKEIATDLFISVHTVTTTIRNLRDRLSASSKYHIISKAAVAGIL